MELKRALMAFLSYLCVYGYASLPNENVVKYDSSIGNFQVVEDGNVTKSKFQLTVENAGDYFLNFWILGSKMCDGSMKQYPIRINGIEVGNATSQTANWHSWHSPQTFWFKKGENTIEILDTAPHVANVTNLFLSQKAIKDSSTERNYANYVSSLKSKKSINSKLTSSLYTKSFNIFKEDETKFPFDASCLIGYKAKYTFSNIVSCKAGDVLSVYTSVTLGGQYVVDVYSYYEPSAFSISLDNPTGSFLKKITIPKKGLYVVRLRGIDDESDGTCDLTINDEVYVDVPFSYVDLPLPKSTFGDKILFVGNNIDIVPSLSVQDPNNKLIEHGYYRIPGVRYLNMGDFENVGSVSVYSDSPTRPYYPVDIYFNAKQLDNPYVISEFKLERKMTPVSAPKDINYNCFAWSVGIWDKWEDPTGDFLTGHLVNKEDYPEEFYYDDFFYCNGYERCKRDEAAICLWGFKEGQDSSFVHAAVRKYSNSDTIPHGFDWESKMGSVERTFHTSDDIMQDKYKRGYGIPLAYYKPMEANARKSMLERVADNDMVLLSSQLAKANIEYLKSNIKLINAATLNEFKKLYDIWRKDACKSIYSTFKELRQLTSYASLRAYVNKYPSLQFEIMQTLSSDDQFALPLIEDVILPNHKDIYEELSAKLKKIKNENRKIYSSSLTNAKMFVDMLLNKNSGVPQSCVGEDAVVSHNNNSKLFVNCNGNICKINANINADYPTTFKIYTVQGNLLATLASHEEFSCNKEFLYMFPQKGTYIVYFENGKNINVKKIIVR